MQHGRSDATAEACHRRRHTCRLVCVMLAREIDHVISRLGVLPVPAVLHRSAIPPLSAAASPGVRRPQDCVTRSSPVWLRSSFVFRFEVQFTVQRSPFMFAVSLEPQADVRGAGSSARTSEQRTPNPTRTGTPNQEPRTRNQEPRPNLNTHGAARRAKRERMWPQAACAELRVHARALAVDLLGRRAEPCRGSPRSTPARPRLRRRTRRRRRPTRSAGTSRR